MMRAAIFDMDGLLIDSEPLWRQAETQAFELVGLHLSDADCEQTMGFRTDEVVAYWYGRVGWHGMSLEAVEAEITSRVRRLIERHGRPMPGVRETLDEVAGAGLALALASSSAMTLIDTVITTLGFGGLFDVICSAENEALGKPDPAVFLTAATRLGVDPATCVVFEDSIAGVQAARAAGMWVVAVPAANLFDDPAFSMADLKLPSLGKFSTFLLPH